MTIPARVNFGLVQVSTGYDDTDLSIVLESGNGAYWSTTFPYNAVWWNWTDFKEPSDAFREGEAEIITITNIATDTLTITRASESTSAVTHNTDGKIYKMHAGVTVAMINAIENAIEDAKLLAFLGV